MLSKSHGDAGYDIRSNEKYVIPGMSRMLISSGISMSFDSGMYAQLHSRSGMALKGIDTVGGVIDSNYRGEIRVILSNTTSQPFQIDIGDRISQIVFHSIYNPNIKMIAQLDSTIRGDSGFGSSGK